MQRRTKRDADWDHVAPAWDGDIDPGIEQRRPPISGERGGGLHDVGAEVLAHAILRLVADFPGHMGRLRAARIVGGFAVPMREDESVSGYTAYGVEVEWPLRQIVELVDSLIEGGLLAQSIGPRPLLVLTRPGYASLNALEAVPA